MSVYQRIDETRRAQGVTLAHLNEIIGGYRGKLTEVKNGKTNLTKDELDKIAVALHVSADYLLGNTDDPRPISAREEQAKPTLPEEGELDASLIGRLIQLTPEEMAKVDAFVQGLLAAR